MNKDSCQAIWETDHEMVWAEQEITLKENCTSFKVNKVTVRTDQLLHIKDVIHSKTHIRESEAEVHGQKKTLMQSLKEFHTHFYGVYEKSTT